MNTLRSDMDGSVQAARLMATVVGALHETQPIRKAMMIGDSNIIQGACCRDSAPFSKWYGNHIAETWEMQQRYKDLGCEVGEWWQCASADNAVN